MRSINAMPVIVRELQAQARQPLTHWLRIVAALALGVVFVLTVYRSYLNVLLAGLDPATFDRTASFALFGHLNATILGTIVFLTPLLSADAISRERREGTLGLLFLTGLRPWEIILGKTLVHIVRALTLYLTMLPWLLVPVLAGGIGAHEVLLAALLDLGALQLALAAGLIATSRPRDPVTAALLAEGLSALFVIVFMAVHLGGLTNLLAAAAARARTGAGVGYYDLLHMYGDSSSSWIGWVGGLFAFTTNASIADGLFRWGLAGGLQTGWGWIWANAPAPITRGWFTLAGSLVVGSSLVLLASMKVAAFAVARSWRDSPGSAATDRWRRTLWTPRYWQTTLVARSRRALERNPVGWLHLRTARVRLVKWMWCLCAAFLLLAASSSLRDVVVMLAGLYILAVAAIAFSAAASFRDERDSGAFELLLVTPLRERQLIWGRVRAIWTQFAPLMALLVGVQWYAELPGGRAGFDQQLPWLILFIAVQLATTPLIGLYFSLVVRNTVVAWLYTMGTLVLCYLLGSWIRQQPARTVTWLVAQIAVGALTLGLLHLSLTRRRFLRTA